MKETLRSSREGSAAEADAGKDAARNGATVQRSIANDVAKAMPKNPPSDPLLGKIIADRYEVVSLIKGGAMGAVYRARQRSLERDIAIKFIHPDLVSEGSVQRFMAEAHAVSRMNHPHVVSVFDFGRTSETDGNLLFLVMELLTGIDLAEVLERSGVLPLARAVDIVCQVLQALAEAHYVGIVHRDVKPDNVILTPTRAGDDDVRLIDFGIARIVAPEPAAGAKGAEGDETPSAFVGGTPAYMAPEQALGKPPRPSADLYSVGVMLFELLAGRLPFEKPTAVATMLAHMTEPRPDPRLVAPDRAIPDALAEACLRAMQMRPALRFPTAEVFEETLRDAMRSQPDAPRMSGERGSVRSRRGAEAGSQRPTAPNGGRGALSPRPGTVATYTGTALIGRESALAWAREQLHAAHGPPWIAFTGRPGVGRSALLRAVGELAEQDGAAVIPISLDPPPYDEIGYRGLLQLIARLTGLSVAELTTGEGFEPTSEPRAIEGLRVLYPRSAARRADPVATRRAAAAAFGWAVRTASARSEGARVVLLIDDVDRLDLTSRRALLDQQRDEPIQGLSVVSTSEQIPVGGPEAGLAIRPLAGLCRADALRMLRARSGELPLTRSDDDIEPLYIEELGYSRRSEAQAVPATLSALLELRVQELDATQRRVLQAVAIVGVAPIGTLPTLLRHPGNKSSEPPAATTDPLRPLVDGGFLSVNDGNVTLTHKLFARIALAGTPGGAVAEIHAAAAEGLSRTPEWLELRAYHALRGRADFEAFLVVEDAARMRAQRGDDAGAIAMLWQAVGAARTNIMRGQGSSATAALSVFGRKLATALVNDGRLEEARGILEEVLRVGKTADMGRALVLEQLAALAQLRGRGEEATRRRSEALQIAEARGDQNVAERLRAFLAAGVPPRSGRADTPLAIEPGRRPVLIVEDDRAIREGLKSIVESDGREAFVAANGKEALEVLRRIPRPGLILLDLMMPVMTGWELLERLRADEMFATIPVVVVSAVSKREEPGATRVLQKPVDVGTLLEVVEEFCG